MTKTLPNKTIAVSWPRPPQQDRQTVSPVHFKRSSPTVRQSSSSDRITPSKDSIALVRRFFLVWQTSASAGPASAMDSNVFMSSLNLNRPWRVASYFHCRLSRPFLANNAIFRPYLKWLQWCAPQTSSRLSVGRVDFRKFRSPFDLSISTEPFLAPTKWTLQIS